MRYILIAFGFMAWAFYELSGGSEFDPDALRVERMAELDMKEPRVIAPAPKVEPVVLAEAPTVVVKNSQPLPALTQPRKAATAEADVTRVALNLTKLEKAETPAASEDQVALPEIKVPENAIADAIEQAVNSVPQNLGNITSSADTPAIIPSLIAPETASATQVAGFEDIRRVSGNRVNVRGGPGTGFDVVGRLVRGDEIRVLEDNGVGWVRFETPDGATGGWMADFLLTSG